MLYFAYGSNLHHFQMKRRCKDSIFLKKINLKDFKLTFRSKYRAADIEAKKNSIVPGALFEISKSDERKLDVYEDFPNLYKKHYFYYYGKKVMTYTMVKKSPFKFPTERYLNVVKKGYKDCNLDSKFLKYICDKNSNNLFSAAQIIEKLSLIDEIDININDQNLNKLFSSDSQYSSFLLFDYCIKADYVNILNSINFLKSNKISISVIIWVFIRKFHEYTRHINKIEQGASIDEIVKNIWPYEQKEITRMALSKFSIKMIEMYISMFIRLDMQSKNLVKGDTWLSLKDLCIAISKNKHSILKLN